MTHGSLSAKTDSKGRILLPSPPRDELALESEDLVSLRRTKGSVLVTGGGKRDYTSKFKKVARHGARKAWEAVEP